MARNRNTIEILITAQDQASKTVKTIFDAYGRAASELDSTAQASAQKQDALGRSVEHAGNAALGSRQHFQHLARVAASELGPAVQDAAGIASSLAFNLHGVGIAGTAAAAAGGTLAIVYGKQVVDAFLEASRARKALETASRETLATGSADPLKKVADEARDKVTTLAKERLALEKQLADAKANPPSGRSETEPGVPSDQDITRAQQREVDRIQKRIELKRLEIVEANRLLGILEQGRALEESEADAERQGLDLAERRRRNAEALRDLNQAIETSSAGTRAARAEADAREAGRQADRIAQARRADRDIIEGQEAIRRATAEANSQVVTVGRSAAAERIRLVEEETRAIIQGVQEQTTARQRGIDAQLESTITNRERLQRDPFFNADNPQGAGLRQRADALLAEERKLQTQLTETAQLGARDRAKAELDGAAQVRQIKQQLALDEIALVRQRLEAEKQVRADLTTLEDQAIQRLKERGALAITKDALRAEVNLLKQEQQQTLRDFERGDVVPITDQFGAFGPGGLESARRNRDLFERRTKSDADLRRAEDQSAIDAADAFIRADRRQAPLTADEGAIRRGLAGSGNEFSSSERLRDLRRNLENAEPDAREAGKKLGAAVTDGAIAGFDAKKFAEAAMDQIGTELARIASQNGLVLT